MAPTEEKYKLLKRKVGDGHSAQWLWVVADYYLFNLQLKEVLEVQFPLQCVGHQMIL